MGQALATLNSRHRYLRCPSLTLVRIREAIVRSRSQRVLQAPTPKQHCVHTHNSNSTLAQLEDVLEKPEASPNGKSARWPWQLVYRRACGSCKNISACIPRQAPMQVAGSPCVPA